MNYEVEDQYNVFIKDVETGLLSHELYLREDEYEDEYSHSVIDRGHVLLSERIRKYLHDKLPNQYCVFVDWCVHVMSVEMAEKKNMFGQVKTAYQENQSGISFKANLS